MLLAWPGLPGPSTVGGTVLLLVFAFVGVEVALCPSGEVKDPARTVPRAVFLSLLIVVPIYLLVAFAALGALQPENMASWQFLGLKKETALVEVARGFFPGGGRPFD